MCLSCVQAVKLDIIVNQSQILSQHHHCNTSLCHNKTTQSVCIRGGMVLRCLNDVYVIEKPFYEQRAPPLCDTGRWPHGSTLKTSSGQGWQYCGKLYSPVHSRIGDVSSCSGVCPAAWMESSIDRTDDFQPYFVRACPVLGPNR